MADKPRLCVDCAHSYTLPATPKYRRCKKSVASMGSDATLAGSMRAPDGACGPAATLFEAKTNGQA